MIRSVRAVVVLVSLCGALPATGFAQTSAADCVVLSDAAARLACYVRLHVRPEPAVPAMAAPPAPAGPASAPAPAMTPADDDDNPDISDYVGRTELRLARYWFDAVALCHSGWPHLNTTNLRPFRGAGLDGSGLR
jgi:hypothetical protein